MRIGRQSGRHLSIADLNSEACSGNLCANVINNLKRIYSLFKNHFCDATIESKITSSVVKYRHVMLVSKYLLTDVA